MVVQNGANGNNGQNGKDGKSDPTSLTMDVVLREVGHVREMYDLRFEQLDLRLQQRFDAQSKALDAALASADAKTGTLSAKIDELRSFQFSVTGKDTAIPTITDQIAQLGSRVDSLSISRDTTQGKSLGVSQFYGYLVGGMGFTIGLISFIINVTGK